MAAGQSTALEQWPPQAALREARELPGAGLFRLVNSGANPEYYSSEVDGFLGSLVDPNRQQSLPDDLDFQVAKARGMLVERILWQFPDVSRLDRPAQLLTPVTLFGRLSLGVPGDPLRYDMSASGRVLDSLVLSPAADPRRLSEHAPELPAGVYSVMLAAGQVAFAEFIKGNLPEGVEGYGQ